MPAAAASTLGCARGAVQIAQDEDAPRSESPDRGLPASIDVLGVMLTGVRIGGKGEYTNARGYAYRGQANDAKAEGLGVLTYRNGSTWSGEWSAGVRHGHAVDHYPNGAVWYFLYDRGTRMHSAYVRADGAGEYDRQRCAADDARLLALAAAALDVDVRPCHSPAAIATLSRCAAMSASVCSGPIACAAGARAAHRRRGGVGGQGALPLQQ
jgi:hypothetical protein